MTVTLRRASDPRMQETREVSTLADILAIGREVAPYTHDQDTRSTVIIEDLITGKVTIMQYDSYIE